MHFSFVHCCICALRWFCICVVDLCIFHFCIVVFVLCVGFAFVWWIACGRNQSGNHGCNSHNALKSKKPNDDPADCWQVKRKHYDIMIINCIGDHKKKRFTSLNWYVFSPLLTLYLEAFILSGLLAQVRVILDIFLLSRNNSFP